MWVSIILFPIFAHSILNVMKELLIRSVSGLVLATLLLGCIFVSPWAYAALLLFIVAVGTFEMARLMHMDSKAGIIIGEACSLGAFGLAALVALQVVAQRWLLLELLLPMMPFLYALFSVKYDAKPIVTYLFASLTFLSLPSSMMLFLYREDLFGSMAGPELIVLVFCLLWANDIFAYLTGKLLGKHKLFPRISPGKTIEGCIGGLVFTIIAMMVFAHYAEWLPISDGVGMAAIAVIFGTLGDLCESMLKRQAGVKDSGKLIPGHGGILDRFDSVMFSVPFIFVYLLLL
jgi:phosphatidate cytidylyltransferase